MAAQKFQMSFDFQPTLRGDLIEVRPLRAQDFAALFEAASDPLIWEQHPDNNRHKKAVFEEFFRGAIDSKGAFAVIERKSGEIIGSSRFWNLNTANDEVEIGWTFLSRKFWGGRYNRELKSLMLEHAFRFVERVLFIVGEDNLRSRKAVENIGGAYLKTIVRPGRDGVERRNVVYVITRSEFRNGRQTAEAQ